MQAYLANLKGLQPLNYFLKRGLKSPSKYKYQYNNVASNRSFLEKTDNSIFKNKLLFVDWCVDHNELTHYDFSYQVFIR